MIDNTDNPLPHDIRFLFRMAEFKNIKRQWAQYHMADCINVAEHTYRVIWIAVILAALNKQNVFKDIILTGLFHDLPESVSGDFHRMNKLYVEEKLDFAALDDIIRDTSLAQMGLAYFTDYEDKRTEAAKYAKDADLLEYELEFVERGIKFDPAFASWKDYSAAYAEKKMRFDLSKRLRNLAIETNPQEWHQKTLAPETYSAQNTDTEVNALHLLYEIGTMRRIDRNWGGLRSSGFLFDNMAEHSLRMVWLTLLLSLYEGEDLEDSLIMALLYTIPVTRTGDDYPYTRPHTKTNRDKALRDMLADTPLGKKFDAVITAIDRLETPVSRIVHDAKVLDTIIEVRRYCTLFHDSMDDKKFARWLNEPPLQTKTGKRFFESIRHYNEAAI